MNEPISKKNRPLKIKKTITKKKFTNLNNVNANYYSKVYKNTKFLPKTTIINQLLFGFQDFMEYKKSEAYKNIGLHTFFIVDPTVMPVGLKENSINTTLKMNPNMPLDKMIAYSFYISQSFIFKDENTYDTIAYLKYQMGKDIKRDDRNINGKLYSASYYSNENYYAIADLFYQNIIDTMQKISNSINLNVVNKIALLSCQNIFNLLTNLITVTLNDILSPEINSVFRASKYINIHITKKSMYMELIFESQLVISRNGEPMDLEYPCGKLEFVFYIDLLKNMFEMKKFVLNYNVNKCGPELEERQSSDAGNINENGNMNNTSYMKTKYMVPAALLTAGIVATPFLLGALGGNKTRKRKNKLNKRTKNKVNKKRNK
jgi:hypothetical protein